jgi:hypothetical protein
MGSISFDYLNKFLLIEKKKRNFFIFPPRLGDKEIITLIIKGGGFLFES